MKVSVATKIQRLYSFFSYTIHSAIKHSKIIWDSAGEEVGFSVFFSFFVGKGSGKIKEDFTTKFREFHKDYAEKLAINK